MGYIKLCDRVAETCEARDRGRTCGSREQVSPVDRSAHLASASLLLDGRLSPYSIKRKGSPGKASFPRGSFSFHAALLVAMPGLYTPSDTGLLLLLPRVLRGWPIQPGTGRGAYLRLRRFSPYWLRSFLLRWLRSFWH